MTYSQIEQLLARFLDGQTSEAEEKLLGDYFREAEDVPVEWKAYQEMFASFDTDAFDFSDEELDVMCTEVGDDCVGVGGSPVESGKKIATSHSRFFIRWGMGAVAAVLLLGIVGTAAYMLSDRFSRYESMDIEASAPDSIGELMDSVGVHNMERSMAFVGEAPMPKAATTDDMVQRHVTVAVEHGVSDRALAAEMKHEDADVEDLNDAEMPGAMVDIPNFEGIMEEVRKMNERMDACMQVDMDVASHAGNEARKVNDSDANPTGVSSCGCPFNVSDEVITVAAYPRIP